MIKRAVIFTIFAWLSVIFQSAFFSVWSLFGASPQILVVFGFLFLRFKVELLWWFLFLYFLFYEGLAAPGQPGILLLLSLLFFYLLQFLQSRYFRLTGVSSLIYFALISLFVSAAVLGERELRVWLLGLVVNFFLYLFLYPVWQIARHLSQSSGSGQLSLRI